SRPVRLALRALQLARRGRVPEQAPLGDALPVRRSPREEGRQVAMEGNRADALVFFGATGDLAYKKIFPSLQAMIRRGHLDVPVIGVAKSGWNLERFRARVKDSLDKHGGIDVAAEAKLQTLLHYVDGDYTDATTFKQPRSELGSAQRAAHYLAIPPVMFGKVVQQLAASGSATGARVIVEKPFGTDLASA